MKYAFRCKNCGRLHEADHAGENEHPHACCVCGAGVSYNDTVHILSEELADPTLTLERRMAIAQELSKAAMTTTKVIKKDNWEVLHLCDDRQLSNYGLTRDDVAEHKPCKSPGHARAPQHVVVHGVEESLITDKAS